MPFSLAGSKAIDLFFGTFGLPETILSDSGIQFTIFHFENTPRIRQFKCPIFSLSFTIECKIERFEVPRGESSLKMEMFGRKCYKNVHRLYY